MVRCRPWNILWQGFPGENLSCCYEVKTRFPSSGLVVTVKWCVILKYLNISLVLRGTAVKHLTLIIRSRCFLENLIINQLVKELHDFWNRNISFVFHKNPRSGLILRHLNPVHTLRSCFSKSYFNIILQCTNKSMKWFRRLRFFDQNFVCISCSPHLIL